MKKAFDQYRRLAKSMLGMSSVWMGEDHLVYVSGSGILLPFKEKYRRFRYQDIQYVAISRRSRALSITCYSLALALLVGLVATLVVLMNRGTIPANLAVVMGIGILALGATFFLWLLLRHQVLGPACVCDIKTNLKRERLKPLNRLHQAEQALELLGGVIDEKQSYLLEIEPSAPDEKTELVVDKLRRGQERVHIAATVLPTFIDYTAFGVLALAALHFESIVLVAAGLALCVLGNVALIASLIRSFQKRSPDSIRRTLLALLAGVLVFGGTAIVYFIHMAAVNPVFTASVTGPFEAFAGIATLGGLTYYLFFLIEFIFILVVALLGLSEAWKWQKRIATSKIKEVDPA